MSKIRDAREKRGRGGLFRGLLLPLLALVIAVGALGSLWTGWLRMTEESETLHKTLRGNAEMIERMRLSMGDRMAGHLSTAMGVPVGVVTEGDFLGDGDEWSEENKKLAEMAARADGGVAEIDGFEVLAVELAGGQGHLVALHPRSWIWGWRSLVFLGFVVPIGALAAYVIARKLAKPLEDLADTAPAFVEVELPSKITERLDEVGILARALEGAREQIINEQALRERSERLAMLGQIATGLAHEIKNPASAILMQSEMMEGNAGQLVRREAEEIVALVNQWLFIAQPCPPRKELHDLVSEIRAMVKSRADVFLYHAVEVKLDLPELMEVECDVRRVMQAVRNIVDNGMAAMPSGGKLTISLKVKDGMACLKVRDRGSGFSKEALSRVGEPFYSEKEGGMGLGLAMVKGVAEAHGGRLEVENDEGGIVRMWLAVREDKKA